MIETVVADAHAYPFDGSVYYGDERNPTMVEVAETYGVMMRDITAEVWGDRPWCWTYEIKGPRANVRAALVAYWGEDDVDQYFV